MKIQKFLPLSFFILFICSCTNDSKDNSIYYISFDDLSGYLENSTIINNNGAYSGNKLVRLNKDYMYGPTFSKKIGELRLAKINSVVISGWVKTDNKANGIKLVCSIDNTEKTVFWEAVDSKTSNLEKDSWLHISTKLDISKFNNSENKLNIYPMHEGPGNTYLDDLEFYFE